MYVRRNSSGAMVVGKAEADAARRRLTERGVDCEKLAEEARAVFFSEKPAGSTPDCLLDEEVIFLAGDPAAPVPEPRLSAITAHLSTCRDCQENVADYKQMEAEAAAREALREPHFVLDSWARLRHEAGQLVLDLILLPRNVQPLPQVIVEGSVQLGGAMSAHGCTVTAIDIPECDVHGLRATFHPDAVPAAIGPDPVCDWVDLTGELESGQTFTLRSLVCISGEPHEP